MKKKNLQTSRNIAGLVGPMLAAVTLSESELVQPHLYDTQIPPVVYLSGALLLLAGISIVRAHNRWVAGWPVLITLVGWLAVFLGLFRMLAAGQYEQVAQRPGALLVLEAIGFAVGVFLTYKAYSWDRRRTSAR